MIAHLGTLGLHQSRESWEPELFKSDTLKKKSLNSGFQNKSTSIYPKKNAKYDNLINNICTGY